LVRAQLETARRPAPADGAPPTPATPVGDRAEALALAVADHIRGRITLRDHRPVDARPALEQALARYRAEGHVAAVATCLADLGRAAMASGDPALGRR
jgi:hypothetical protein